MSVSDPVLTMYLSYIPNRPEEVQQVPWTAGLQDHVHGQTEALAEQHPDHVVMLTYCGMEPDPLHKLSGFTLVGTI